jgi:hypothetical protein
MFLSSAFQVWFLWSKNTFLHCTPVLASNRIGQVQGIGLMEHNCYLRAGVSHTWRLVFLLRRSKIHLSQMVAYWENAASSILWLESAHASAMDVNSRYISANVYADVLYILLHQIWFESPQLVQLQSTQHQGSQNHTEVVSYKILDPTGSSKSFLCFS